MRILQLINGLSTAGAEILVVETSKRYLKKGHKVDICLLSSYDAPLLQEVRTVKDINILSLGKNHNFYNPLCILKLAKRLKGTDYDIIHVHLFPSFYWAALAKFAYRRSKLVYTEHNTNNRRMSNAFYRFIDNLIYPRYDCHIAISETVRKRLDAHIDTSRNKVVTIYNGINLNSIKLAKPLTHSELGIPENCHVVLQVSAFRPQKNQATLIRAVSRLSPKVHLLLAGEGELQESNQKLAKDLGIIDRVHFLGVRKDVPRLLKSADVIVLSTHYEGLSLASVEGLASGKPLIASNVPGLTEVVEGAGILFTDDDEIQLAKEIEHVLNDPEYSRKVSLSCMKRAEKYNLESMVDQYLALYQILLNNS